MYDKRHNTVREAGRDLWITDFSDLGRKEKKEFYWQRRLLRKANKFKD